VCVCSLAYAVSNAHVPYCHLWLVWLCMLSPKRGDFRGGGVKLSKISYVFLFIFSVIFVWNISHFEKQWAKYDKKCVLVIMSSTCYSCRTVVKLEFSLTYFKKILIYQILWKSFQWEQSCSMWTDERTDWQKRQTDTMKLIVAFRNLRMHLKKEWQHAFDIYLRLAGKIYVKRA